MISEDCASTSKSSENCISSEHTNYIKTEDPLEKVCWINGKNRGIVYNPILKKYVLKELPFYEMDSNEENRKLLDEMNENLEKQKIEKPIESPESPIAEKKQKSRSCYSGDNFWKKRGGEPVVDAKCSICEEKFITIRSLLDHRLLVHSESEMLTCSFCGLKYSKRTHISQHLFLEYQVYKCETCSKCFRCDHHLKTHRCGDLIPKYVPRKKKENVSCQKCSKKFVYQATLEKHQLKCGQKVAKKKQTFYLSTDALLDHDYIEQPKCKKCNILFQSLTFLNEHYQNVHATGYKCPYCLTTYMHKKWYTYHVKNCASRQVLSSSSESDLIEPENVIDDDFYCLDQPQPRNRTRKLIEEMRGQLYFNC